jgi:diguanylate cyclase (GGDEF)-like protein
MAGVAHPVADWSEIRFRTESVRAGVRLAAFIFGAGLCYVAVTWDHPHRPALICLLALILVLATVVSWLLVDRIVRSPRRELSFILWSLAWIGTTAALMGLDGGGSSPLALLFFLPLVFAALSYPLRSVAFLGAFSELMFVFVATVAGQSDPVRTAFSAGALAVTAVLCTWQAQTHERGRQRLTAMSRTDPLTGCFNRRGFEELVTRELEQASRSGEPFAIVMFDLDGFKRVNDTQGHAAGDALLRWTVGHIAGAIRSADALGRIGGDEFAVLLRGATREEARQIAGRVQNRLGARVSTSLGVASFPADGTEIEKLLREADVELYREKDSTRPSPRERELSLAAVLARAVDMRTGEDHSRRADYATGIAAELGWNDERVELIRIAALLHDVGKASIPDSVLREPADLGPDERAAMERHPVVAGDLLAGVDGLEPIAPWVRHSHEHVDGSGYPDRLRGDRIPLGARILRVADEFDQLTDARRADRALSHEAALEELRRASGTTLDAAAVEALARAVAPTPTDAPVPVS